LKPKINELPFCYKPISLRNGSWVKWWVIAPRILGSRQEKSTNHKGRKYAKNSVHIVMGLYVDVPNIKKAVCRALFQIARFPRGRPEFDSRPG
jgi:hypothetical protein